MTERLYEGDSHLTGCTATVTGCTRTETGFDVTLDRTILFPNAGGQPCDTGTIGGVAVTGCDESGDDILHHTSAALAVGKTVEVALDWDRRFDHMQQHTGEHLLSYAIYTLYGINNVGFHLAADTTTIDLSAPLSSEQLLAAEQLASRYVFSDLSVTARCYDDEAALDGLPLRKHAEGLKSPIRIVTVETADCCTCCAPHCRRTGEVGGILVTDAMSYKGGVRLNFLCGFRALRYFERVHGDMDRLARRFSTGRDNVLSAVTKLQDDCTQYRRHERELEAELNVYLARDLRAEAVVSGGTTLSVAALPDLPPARLKALAQQTLSEKKSLSVLLSFSGGRLGYVLCSTPDLPLDMGELCQAVNAATGGKGGGRGTLAQGTALSDRGLSETVEQLRAYFVRRLAAK